MKKLASILTVLILITSFSCSSDDDSQVDPIIGEWNLHKVFIDNEEQDLAPCANLSGINFFSDGSLENIFYIHDNNGGCIMVDTTPGTWSNLGNGNYSTTFEEDTNTAQITFQANTFYVEETDTSTTTDSNGNTVTTTETRRTVFIKN